ncbi:hypothetical protein SD37_17455 [Amycolatopsis orientalis]|uniref:Uncharacterized protein n=1 Tax=Amycolatopsis orientalis TaxID=31958 RepID=A0A193BYK7_AMYOR|nr:hypothetical protein SD37_17455 [Amycolatopsis orientalis]
MLAQSDSEMPKVKASHAVQVPPVRSPSEGFQSSTVAIMRRPSTMSGQIAAVVWSAPNCRAKSRP